MIWEVLKYYALFNLACLAIFLEHGHRARELQEPRRQQKRPPVP